MFEHLKELEVKDKTAEFPLTALRGCPKLIVRPATESNPSYFNEVLRRYSKMIRKVSQKKEITVTTDDLARNRNEDRNLFPKYVITDWKDVVDSKGNNVPFSEENCREFLKALPDWIFDSIGIFCRDNSNFVPSSIDQEDLEEFAKD